jgi:4-hydroxythreonine-4-phosphate dehydrogenase
MALRIAVTTGEPAGIGPEVALRAVADSALDCDLMGDAGLIERTAHVLGLPWPLEAVRSGRVRIQHEPLAAAVRPGVPDVANAPYVLRLLDHAIEGWCAGTYAALATAPVHKGIINDAGIAFTGHTEYLARATGAESVVMLLVGGGLRVALATTHRPLAAVPAAITRPLLDACLDVLARDLSARFGMAEPRIAVTGLNPHAGEGGHLGREEIDVIGPAIEAARARGIRASGPWPGDTVFVAARKDQCDVVLAMYHDQGLATLKYASFGMGVNVTLGMPMIRASADHGTALDIAGQGRADAGSMKEALALAAKLAANEESATGALLERGRIGD